jgi:hypothetical protein
MIIHNLTSCLMCSLPPSSIVFNYLISICWQDGPYYPKCQNVKFLRSNNDQILQCSGLRQKIRPLAGTIFQDTHIVAEKWFNVAWLIMSQKFGTIASGLLRVMDWAYSTT